MANYKVLQDIEAEDKLIGPLTLRQFIYAGILALCIYLSFIALTKHLTFLLLIFLPVALFSGFFAFPWKLNQPTETWALAKIRFLIKPRKRIWDQSGAKNLVTVTAPKKELTNYTNNLSENEVNSRLRSLADTLDSRGWAIKNNGGDFTYTPVNQPDSDRLIAISPSPTLVYPEAKDTDDILDDNNNPTAQRFNQMINDSSVVRRNNLESNLRLQQGTNSGVGSSITQAAPPPIISLHDTWFIKNPAVTNNPQVGSNPSSITQQRNALVDNSKKLLSQDQNITIIDPQSPVSTINQPTGRPTQLNSPSVTQNLNPVILNLAGNNDLSVATLARQINRQQGVDAQGEVTIQLH